MKNPEKSLLTAREISNMLSEYPMPESQQQQAGRLGGKQSWANLTRKQRKEKARMMARVRWDRYKQQHEKARTAEQAA